jgi:hypothetical protein
LVIQYLYLNNYYISYSYIPNNNIIIIIVSAYKKLYTSMTKSFLTVEFTKGDGLRHLQV